MKKILLSAMLLAAMNTMQAEEQWIGYGDYEAGTIGATSYGIKSTTVYTAAIKIPASQVAAYVGGSINSIQFAIAKTSPNITYFITDQLGDASQEIVVEGGLEAGWHQFTPEFPYMINEAKDLYIGYTTKGKSNVIAIEKKDGAEGSCIIGENGTYTDYYVEKQKDYSLDIRALVVTSTGSLATLSFSSLFDLAVDPETPTTVNGRVMLLTSEHVTSFGLNVYLDGELNSTPTFDCNLQTRGDKADYSFELPGLALGRHTYGVELAHVNGAAVAEPYRSESTITARLLFARRNVVEECTGTWCGWCVRGIVGMETMREKYPDRFIGIAVHGGDDFQASTYASLLNRAAGYPDAFFNRAEEFDPSAANIEAKILNSPEMCQEEVKIVEARFTDDTHKTLAIKTVCRFSEVHTQVDYRLAFVILEDNLPAVQSNYYAGGGSGAMGGFERQGQHVQVNLMDVARDIKSYAGIVNSVPAELLPGEEYEYTYEYDLPATIKNMDNVSVVALLQDKNGTKIMNADKCVTLSDTEITDGIEAVRNDQCATPSAIYDLQGQPARQLQSGVIYVGEAGKRIIR